nr:MAG TPA: hypothetical protein [Caudoviricetes sp.]
MSIVGVTRKNRIYENYKRQRIKLSLVFNKKSSQMRKNYLHIVD